MVKILYHITAKHHNRNIEFTVTLESNNSNNYAELALLIKGTKGQFVDFFMYNKLNNKLEYTVVAYEITTGDEKIVLDTKADVNADFNCSYIYSINHQDDAIGYSMVVPKLYIVAKDAGALFNISKNNNLYSTYYAGVYSIYNGGKKPVIIYLDNMIEIQPGEIHVDKNTSYIRRIADEKIRTNDGYGNISYRDLSPEERQKLIPKSIITDGKYTIHWGISTEWIPATQHQFKTTLVYQDTRDKDFHFNDENTGQKYKYNIDGMRMILPYLVNGRISATFIYKNAGNTNIRFVPVPISCDDKDNGTLICESDDSDYDNED